MNNDEIQNFRKKLTELVKENQTPFYIYELERLHRQYLDFKSAFPFEWFSLYFATMANDRDFVLKRLSSLNVGACVNSLPHLELSIKSGFNPEKIQYSSTGLSEQDMQKLISERVQFNVDSPSQLKQWISLGGTKAGFRVNASCLSNDRPKDRIGMSLSDVETAKKMAVNKGLKVNGLHVYIGTNLPSHTHLVPTVKQLFELATGFKELEYINIGGGIGVDYLKSGDEFSLAAYSEAIQQERFKLCKILGRNLNIIIEPGRKLTASCGKLVTKVTDIKYLHDYRYVSVDASVAIFPRPLIHPEARHNVWTLNESASLESDTLYQAIIVGKTTFSGDILSVTMLPESIGVDDILVFDDAGSYSQSMESRFLGQRTPVSFFLDN